MKIRSLTAIVLMLATALSAQTIIGYTSFEEPSTGDQYVDTGNAAEDHALINNSGQATVNYTSTGGEMGFSTYYTNTRNDVGVTDGDYIGVTDYTPGTEFPFPDGNQGFQLSDADGKLTVTLDELTVESATTVYFTANYFVVESGYEADDFIRLWLTIDGSDVDLLNTIGSDIDDLGIENEWKTITHSATVNSSIVFQFELESNAGYEALYMDNIVFTTGSAVPNPPIANAGSDQFAATGSTVTLDGSGSSDPDNNIDTYMWTQVSGTTVTLSNPNSVTTTFTAPSADADLAFELLVTDDTDLESKDTVNITVREPQETDLIFSEYIEGSSNNKAFEIYNISDATVDLTPYVVKISRDGYGWGNYAVGEARDALVLDLSGSLAPGEVYVVARTEADASIVAVADITFEYSNTVPGAYTVCFTGNDALGLFLNDILVDVIGNPSSSSNFNVAGVTGATADHTLIRKSTVDAGNIDWISSSGTDADNSEWIVMDQDYFGDLGTHSAGPQAYTINNIEVATAFPQAGSEIEVKANVIPGESSPAPSSVKLWYGSGGTQANSVDMFLESGTVYAAAIPSIADGNLRLEYYVQASNGSSSSKSSVRSILVAGTPMSISEIHAGIETLDGQIKTIEGVVTIGAGILRDDRTSAYLQDNSGRGLNIYHGTLLEDLERGAHVKMVGEVDLYYTTVELKDFEYTVVSTGETLPAPIEVSVSGANSSALEGTLAKVTGTLDKIIDYTGSKNLILKDGTDTTIVKIWGTTGINTDAFQTGILYAITGVGSQYSDEYQLLVGYADDIDPTVAVGETDAPDAFALAAPYPNPFNPATTVTYRLDRPGTYSLGVFNLTGRQVASLAQGYAEAGEYSLSWNAADFTSGIYFIRLQSAERVATRKVVLIK